MSQLVSIAVSDADMPVLAPEAFTTELLCARMLERHRGIVRVQKDHVAARKLAKIVTAALELANRDGFHAMSLRALASRSGVSMGSLYSYFDSKTMLLTMILSEVAATATEVLDHPPPDCHDDPRRHLNWLIDTHIRLTEIMQPWFAFAFMEAKSFPPPARRMAVDSEAATERVFANVLKRGVEQGAFVLDDPDFAAALIKPLLQDWYVKRAKYRKRGTTMASYIKAVLAFVDAAVTARRV